MEGLEKWRRGNVEGRGKKGRKIRRRKTRERDDERGRRLMVWGKKEGARGPDKGKLEQG